MVALWAVSHFLRAIGLTLTYHRYFAHRAFKMGRLTQFVWSYIAASAMQKGPLWWAGHHVTHHKFADREGDPHSPIVSGFYYAHLGWFLNNVRNDRLPETNPVVRDFGKFPELRLLDTFYWVPPAAAGPRSLRVRRHAVAGVGLPAAHDDARARHLRHQHHQSPLRLASVRHRRRIAQQRDHGAVRGRRGLAQQPPPLPARRRATASTGGSSIPPGT